MPTFAIPNNKTGVIAQLVEQRTENPCVPGSIPGDTTENLSRSNSAEVFSYWETSACFTRHIPGGLLLSFRTAADMPCMNQRFLERYSRRQMLRNQG